MFGNISGPTLIVILFIVLLLFGAPKLPALARSLGQSMKILKKEVTTNDDESKSEAEHAPTASSAAPAATSPAASSSDEDEVASARAEAAAAQAEADALRAAAQKRTEEGQN